MYPAFIANRAGNTSEGFLLATPSLPEPQLRFELHQFQISFYRV